VTRVVEPTLFQLLNSCVGVAPHEERIGLRFEVLTLPEEDALAVVEALARFDPHPVGAAVADLGRWSLLLPPGSGEEVWAPPAKYQASGWLVVPPVGAPQAGALRWARFGNATGRALTAPLLLASALTARASVSSCRAPGVCGRGSP
jgi:hypothetical protein